MHNNNPSDILAYREASTPQLQRRIQFALPLFLLVDILLVGLICWTLFSHRASLAPFTFHLQIAAIVALSALAVGAYIWLDSLSEALNSRGQKRTLMTYYRWSLLVIFGIGLIFIRLASTASGAGQDNLVYDMIAAGSLLYTVGVVVWPVLTILTIGVYFGDKVQAQDMQQKGIQHGRLRVHVLYGSFVVMLVAIFMVAGTGNLFWKVVVIGSLLNMCCTAVLLSIRRYGFGVIDNNGSTGVVVWINFVVALASAIYLILTT